MIDITRKDLSKQYPVYTKAGNIWKNRIDWNSILKPGTVISTHFGIFTFVSTYKENKVWYLVLEVGDKYITIKRQQARNNKKIPKNSKVTYKLNTLVDNIFTEVRAAVVEHNLEVLNKQKGKRGKKSRKYCYGTKPMMPDLFGKIRYINALGKKFKSEEYKMYRRWIINFYHPDHNPKISSAFMKELYFLLA